MAASKQPLQAELLLQKQVANYLTRAQTATEVAKALNLSIKEAQRILKGGLEGYAVISGPRRANGNRTYIAVKALDPESLSPQEWKWMGSSIPAQPYGIVTLPEMADQHKIRVVPISDVYFGSSAHVASRFNAVLRYIRENENTFCYLNGNIVDLVIGGKRKEREQVFLQRVAQFEQKLAPIAHKILWAQQGTLEATALRQQGLDPLDVLRQSFKVPYFTEPVYIDLMWREKLFKIWTMHGHSTAQVKGARINALRRPAQLHDFTHFIVMGHIADAMWNKQPKIHRDVENCRLRARNEYLIILGGFCKYFGTRDARRGNTPPSRETIVLNMYANGTYCVKTLHGDKEEQDDTEATTAH